MKLFQCAAVLLATLLAASFAAAGPAAQSGYRLLVLNGGFAKWGDATLGSGSVVTVAVAATRMEFPDAINCASIKPIDDALARNGIARAQFNVELSTALSAWSAAANINFVPGDPATADILIGAEGEPRGHAFTNVKLPAVRNRAVKSIEQSVICLNPSEPWKVGFDGDLSVYDIRYTLMHELGHAIGLDHPGVRGEVMDFHYGESFRELQAGDIAGAQALYGNPVISVDASGPLALPQVSQAH